MTRITVSLLLMLTLPAHPRAEDPAASSQIETSVVSKTVKAINYQYRSGSTKIDFIGTSLMPSARGDAKVERKKGYTEIEVRFQFVEPPARFGTEYLTYVMWSISPDGRASNLGELVLNKRRQAKLNVTSEFQVFGLIVTAEPYFAVRVPSDLVVMENAIRKGTKGRILSIDTNYELLERGRYEQLANPLSLSVDLKKVPLDVYQARNALAIAKLSGAATYASEIFGKAEAHMEMVERVLDNKAMRKQVIQHARRAVQFAEDARGRSVRRQQEEALENERREAAEREKEARARAAEAEARRIAEEEARARAEAEKAEADRRRMAAEQEKAGLRARLLQQFSLVLETRDTDRGLIVNISDVLFDTGQYALRPVAREKLARLSGIVLAYPGLRLRSEGHTDAIGSEVLNQRLSEQRAEAVREYLLTQGVPEHAVSSVGLGFSVPVASNDTREGRQQNRRVEIIVSGEVIGTAVGAAAAP